MYVKLCNYNRDHKTRNIQIKSDPYNFLNRNYHSQNNLLTNSNKNKSNQEKTISYKCVGRDSNKKICIKSNEYPNSVNGIYHSFDDCVNNCKKFGPINIVSYKCIRTENNNKICTQTEEEPNSANGIYYNLDDCQNSCQ